MPSTGLDSRAVGAEHCDEASFTVTTVSVDTIADFFLGGRFWTAANSAPAAARGLCEMTGSRSDELVVQHRHAESHSSPRRAGAQRSAIGFVCNALWAVRGTHFRRAEFP